MFKIFSVICGIGAAICGILWILFPEARLSLIMGLITGIINAIIYYKLNSMQEDIEAMKERLASLEKKESEKNITPTFVHKKNNEE